MSSQIPIDYIDDWQVLLQPMLANMQVSHDRKGLNDHGEESALASN